MSSAVGVQDSVSVDRARFLRPRYCRDAALREFDAEVELVATGTDTVVIGSLGGWLGWRAWLPECAEPSHRGPRLIEELAATAMTISAGLATGGTDISAVLILDHVQLGPGAERALTRQIAEELIDLLLLTPDTTLVMVRSTSAALDAAYRQAGFRRSLPDVWWLPPRSASPGRP